MKVTLETQRLILRPFAVEDAEEVFSNWASDPEVTKYMTWLPHENVEVTKILLNSWVKQYEKPERLNFAIVLKENNELIGGIDVVGYLGGPQGTPVIGYVLSKKYWGRGIATEACKRVLEYLFSLGYQEVRIDAEVENIASNNVIQKCGGQFQKCEEDDIPLKNKKVMVNRYIVNKQSFHRINNNK